MDLPIFDNFEITNIEKNEIKSILYKNIILSEFGITVSEHEIISTMRMTFDKYNGSEEMVESRTLDMICGGNENE